MFQFYFFIYLGAIYLCVDSRVRQTSSNVSGGLEEQLPGPVASNPLPNSGHVGLSTVNYTGAVMHLANKVMTMYLKDMLS